MGWFQRIIDLFRRPRPTPRPTPPAPPPPQPPPQPAADPAGRLFDLINAERKARGLVPFGYEPRLMGMAQQRADDPTVAGVFPHNGWYPLFRQTFPYTEGSEIIAPGYATPEEAVRAFMEERGLVKPHRDAILGDSTHLGTGMAVHGGKVCWVGDLIKLP